MFTTSSFRQNIDSLAAAAAGFLVILLFARHSGIGVNPDSIIYSSAASNLAANGRLYDFMHRPVVEYPALYPSFLSAIILATGLQPLQFAPVLNALLFAIVIYLSGYMLESFTGLSRWCKIALLTCVVCSPPLLEVYSMLWSETLFIALLLPAIIALHQYLQKLTVRALIVTAVLTAMVAVTRYPGVTIIITGTVAIVVDRQLQVRKKTSHLLIFLLISCSLLGVNLARNQLVGTSAIGHRERSLTSFATNVEGAGSVLFNWLPFNTGGHGVAGWFATISMFTLLLLYIRKWRQMGRLADLEDILTIFSLAYLVFIVAMASITRFEQLDSRFLSPVFLPLLLVFGSLFSKILNAAKETKKVALLSFATILFACFQYGQLAADYETWDGVKDAGIPGYTEDQWRYSETVLYLQKNLQRFKANAVLYSNANDAVYFFTARPGRFLPHKDFPAEVHRFLAEPACYVVWFDDGDNPDLVDRKFITGIKKMKLLKQCDDGAIYTTN